MMLTLYRAHEEGDTQQLAKSVCFVRQHTSWSLTHAATTASIDSQSPIAQVPASILTIIQAEMPHYSGARPYPQRQRYGRATNKPSSNPNKLPLRTRHGTIKIRRLTSRRVHGWCCFQDHV